MKKVFILIISYVILLCLTSCDKTKSDSSNNNVVTTKQSDITDSKDNIENDVKEISNQNQTLKADVLEESEKKYLFNLFSNDQSNRFLYYDRKIKYPNEIRLIEALDEYDGVAYSVYKYNDEKIYVFVLREKYNNARSTALLLNSTMYEGLFLLPMDKEYSINDFEDIKINKSDLSDVKKIYKYADILFEQELQAEDSKKKCSIYIMSDDSGITISFKKKGNKYIVTEIENNADGSFVSMIADVDKSFD